MPVTKFKLQWINDAYRQLKPSQLKPIFKENLAIMGQQWAMNYLPKRFDSNGKNVYHLQERTPRYIKRATIYGINRGKAGGGKVPPNPDWRPLLLSGQLATDSRGVRFRTTATQNKIAVTVIIPRGHATRQYVAEEIVRVNKNEWMVLLRNFKDRCMAQIAALIGAKK